MDTSPRPLPRRALPPLQAPSESKSNISKSIRDDADGTLPLDTSSSSMPRSRPPRQKKKARQSSQMNQQLQDEGASNREETQLENGDQVSEMNSTVQTKRARTRRRQANRNKSSRTSTAPQVVTNGYALTNMLSEEDVVPVDHIENLSAMTTLPGVAGGGGNSQPTEKVFVQTTSGFASHTEEWLANRQIAAAQKVSFANNEEQLVTQTSQVALSFHRGFIFLVFLIHGILAGLAIWEVVVAFALSSTGPDNFFTQYSSLAQPTQIVFYILIALCLISALDRYNFAKPGGNMLLDLIRIEPGAWTVIAYLLAFAFNNGLSGVDYWLGQIAPSLQLNQTVSPATPAYLNENPSGSLSTWHAINVLRAVFSALGWILLAVYPTEDETAKHDLLLRLSKNSSLLGKFWIASVLLLRLVVLTVFGDHVWSDEQREFTCNTRQPGCENVCFNMFTPVSNIRMWGLQVLAVCIPAAFYFVYILHAVSRNDVVNDRQNEQKLNRDENSSSKESDSLPSARRKWKALTSHVVPTELHRSRDRRVWKLYLLQIIVRMGAECAFVVLQYTVYVYRWTVPEVFQCSRWPCPHTVDCFVSRPHEKTVFFRYMYLVSAFSILLSLLESAYIMWLGGRNLYFKRQHRSYVSGQPRYSTVSCRSLNQRQSSDLFESNDGD